MNNIRKWLKQLCLFSLFILTQGAFAAPPIQGGAIQGTADARKKLISAAESYMGTPYRYAGLDRSGLDCSGLVYLSFREGLRYTIPRTAESIFNWVEKISTEELQPGDLVFFITAGQRVSHLGIYAGEGRFIHSASDGSRTGVIYSTLDEAYWKRTYRGAGRALPWDAAAAQAMASVWADSGFFVGLGAAFTWGGFFQGAPSIFRGFSAVSTAGYKGSKYRAGIEFRPELDRALGVFRLPFTLSVGTDIIQVFGGPAYTAGEPSLSLSDGERHYSGGGEWRWEAGFSAAFPPLKISRGALSIYGELAWQPYHWEDGTDFSFKPDVTANLRFSTGLRYLWHIR